MSQNQISTKKLGITELVLRDGHQSLLATRMRLDDMLPVAEAETKEGDSGLRPRIDYGRCCWCALCVDVCMTDALSFGEYELLRQDALDKGREIIPELSKAAHLYIK